eukprot:224935-Chlamydomonas_euryale.AAC.1
MLTNACTHVHARAGPRVASKSGPAAREGAPRAARLAGCVQRSAIGRVRPGARRRHPPGQELCKGDAVLWRGRGGRAAAGASATAGRAAGRPGARATARRPAGCFGAGPGEAGGQQGSCRKAAGWADREAGASGWRRR